jgi:hypothetical protein
VALQVLLLGANEVGTTPDAVVIAERVANRLIHTVIDLKGIK